jgi:hypothetical protein
VTAKGSELPSIDDRIIELSSQDVNRVRDGDRAGILERVRIGPFKRNPTQTAERWEDEDYPVIGQLHSETGEAVKPTDSFNNLIAHAIKHTADGGFRQGTTSAQYLANIKAIVGHPQVLVKVGISNRGDPCATLMAMIPYVAFPDLRPPSAPPCSLFVVYAPKQSSIVSGYVINNASMTDLYKTWKRTPFLVKK